MFIFSTVTLWVTILAKTTVDNGEKPWVSMSSANSDAAGKKAGLQSHRELRRSAIWKERTAVYVIKKQLLIVHPGRTKPKCLWSK